ncbi:hypothetical protein [Desulfolutivibrio sulfodismutans]|nr:hypothetical protein [Desulfolutivibrio sulfodismutans]
MTPYATPTPADPTTGSASPVAKSHKAIVPPTQQEAASMDTP